MPTAAECVCCGEIPQTLNKRSDGVEVGCITLHPGFLVYASIRGSCKLCTTAIVSIVVQMQLKVQQMSKQALRRLCI